MTRATAAAVAALFLAACDGSEEAVRDCVYACTDNGYERWVLDVSNKECRCYHEVICGETTPDGPALRDLEQR